MENNTLSIDVNSAVVPSPGATAAASITARRSPRARVPRESQAQAPITTTVKPKKVNNRHRRKNQQRKSEPQPETVLLATTVEVDNELRSPDTGKSGKRSRKRTRRIPRSELPAANETMIVVDATLTDDHPVEETDHDRSNTARRKKRTPYSKKTWQEQMSLLDQEAERARRIEEQEEKKLQRLPPLGKLSVAKLDKVRPKAPRNTTQFLIDSHGTDDDDTLDDDTIQIDEHGSMSAQSSELLALRDEIRKKQMVPT